MILLLQDIGSAYSNLLHSSDLSKVYYLTLKNCYTNNQLGTSISFVFSFIFLYFVDLMWQWLSGFIMYIS